MSWRPPYEDESQAHDPRLDPYRERAAILSGSRDLDATLFLRMETYWPQISGHLWWRRWSEPYESPHGYMVFTNGEFDDWVVYPNVLDEELVVWSQNKVSYAGELLDAVWLDDAASRHVREHVMGLDSPDPDRRRSPT
jgi:hypothetical protein